MTSQPESGRANPHSRVTTSPRLSSSPSSSGTSTFPRNARINKWTQSCANPTDEFVCPSGIAEKLGVFGAEIAIREFLDL